MSPALADILDCADLKLGLATPQRHSLGELCRLMPYASAEEREFLLGLLARTPLVAIEAALDVLRAAVSEPEIKAHAIYQALRERVMRHLYAESLQDASGDDASVPWGGKQR